MIFLRLGMKGQGFFGCAAVLLLAASENPCSMCWSYEC